MEVLQATKDFEAACKAAFDPKPWQEFLTAAKEVDDLLATSAVLDQAAAYRAIAKREDKRGAVTSLPLPLAIALKDVMAGLKDSVSLSVAIKEWLPMANKTINAFATAMGETRELGASIKLMERLQQERARK